MSTPTVIHELTTLEIKVFSNASVYAALEKALPEAGGTLLGAFATDIGELSRVLVLRAFDDANALMAALWVHDLRWSGAAADPATEARAAYRRGADLYRAGAATLRQLQRRAAQPGVARGALPGRVDRGAGCAVGQ